MTSAIELDEILRAAAASRGGEPRLLATVVRIEGASYRRPGARMLVGEARALAGCVSGGCLEDDVVRRAEFHLRGGRPTLIRYDSTSDDDVGWGLGFGCNGVVEILLERLENGPTQDALRFAAACLAEETEGVMATLVRATPDELGARLFLRDGQLVASGFPDHAVPDVALVEAVKAFEAERRTVLEVVPWRYGEALVERIRPVPHVFVVGTRHDARPLLDLGRAMGLRVTVADASMSVSIRERFASADRIVAAAPEALARLVDGQHTALAVLMTHDYQRDRDYLGALLTSRACYIGVLGPRRRTEQMLSELGIASGDPRLHAPIGLDLGAETPREIALSIVAELQAALRDASAGYLHERSGPIHPAHAAEMP